MSAGGDGLLDLTALFAYFKGFFAVGFLPEEFYTGAGADGAISSPAFYCACEFSAFWFRHDL